MQGRMSRDLLNGSHIRLLGLCQAAVAASGHWVGAKEPWQCCGVWVVWVWLWVVYAGYDPNYAAWCQGLPTSLTCRMAGLIAAG
eukprot:97290-Chlamydomonas_euryale.AAC.1